MFNPFRRTLSKSVARYYADPGRDPLYPEVVWGLVQDFTTERGKYYRGIARIGMRDARERGRVIWQSRKQRDPGVAERELAAGLAAAAQEYPLDFELVVVEPGSPGTLVVRRRFDVAGSEGTGCA